MAKSPKFKCEACGEVKAPLAFPNGNRTHCRACGGHPILSVEESPPRTKLPAARQKKEQPERVKKRKRRSVRTVSGGLPTLGKRRK